MASTVFADRFVKEGIRVFEIRPGIIMTDMTIRQAEKYTKLIDDGFVPQRRWGMPDDVGKAVASIARGDWDYSAGMMFEVSGGLNIHGF